MKKNQLTAILISLILLGFGVWLVLRTPDAVSEAERRNLTQLPKLTWSALADGSYMTDLESYALDQFPMRDRFRTLHSATQLYLFGMRDVNGIYLYGDGIYKMEYPLSEKGVQRSIQKLTELYETYLTDGNVYMAIVPDKNYYAALKSGHLSIDYETLFARITQGLPFATQIDLTGLLSEEDYYRTDTHWRQNRILPVAEHIASAMNVPWENAYVSEEFFPFYGVLYGQSALPAEADAIVYLTNETLENLAVYNLEIDAEQPVYNLASAEGMDSYDLFLSGAAALQIIENGSALTERELIVFRDSFGSSLVPLLIGSYSKITVVDTRYIMPELLGEYIEFADQDVLFLYSTLILNTGYTFR